MEETSAKKKNGEDINRMSSLPDSLLLHILSFLPTKTCMDTISLVSHRYLHLWKHLQVLNVDEDDFNISRAELFRYISLFVNDFLARRKSRDILKFHLSCDFYLDEFSSPSIKTWIRTAIGPYLEELHLALFSDQDNALKFPLTILSSCTNLVSLSLYGNILPQTQLLRSSMVCLPSLKKLEMELIGDVDVSAVEILLSGCLILEILEVSLSTKSLTTFHVPHSLVILIFCIESEVGARLEIDAPSLKYLSLNNITFGVNAIGNLHKNLLRAISGIKHLFLGCSTSKWFDVEFPEFRHLIHIKLNLPCFHIGFLYHVLQKCPMLQTLEISKYEDPVPPYGLAPKPKSVPNCLVSHLTFIHFRGCQGNLDEMKFSRYVLRKGRVLKTMHISSLSKEKREKDNILKQLSNTPKGSVSCQLKFD